MGYMYENGTPDRFQHLCQSLLIPEFPKLQCYPIGQPDGGRDGWDPESKTVLQVKFKRSDEDENADWIIEALTAELPKIRRLAQRGAEHYILATNARGTAHLDSGRIDKVQAWLDVNVPIPASCYWRDEIDRRFDLAPSGLKLKYSDMLTLEDGLEIAFASVFNQRDDRLRDTVRAFVAKQFADDSMVKFKQVSLTNDLLSLFIDVPANFPRLMLDRLNGNTKKDKLQKLLDSSFGANQQTLSDFEELGIETTVDAPGATRHSKVGAAELLLHPLIQDHLKLVILEGAPGQGKSTLAQYVCQIQRSRYLKKREIFDNLPQQYMHAPFRLPIKIDLRDYASFLEGASPFPPGETSNFGLTFDVFLAQLISHGSGGVNFSPYDVLSLIKDTPLLLFLDGLDEVADITAREGLVTSIGDALSRWQEFDSDLQVVVTSRPSIFGRAPSFGQYGFITVSLDNIDTEQVYNYADNWVAARNLDDTEKRSVLKILRQKLELAHIRDLTRNPMQLTILLSLIHQVGHSLPDQRTDLYHRYVDLFLTREADKSVRVRDNRAVLLGFIQHLAWVLQTQAESSKTSGSISSRDLQSMAREYLTSRGHAPSIADDLFGGGLERIFVLVERIEGLYEFEVQPLREFFCAQHLYFTAPVGTYRDTILRGDRAQRFEALASNPLWLNVCRFYAGSCTRGEIGTLVYSLMEMITTGSPAVSIHARRVGLALLQDWVFSNSKYAQADLIKAIFDDIGIHIMASTMRRGIVDMRIDPACGQDVLRERAFDLLGTLPNDGRVSTLCTILRFNGGNNLQDDFLATLKGTTGFERTQQLERMFKSGASDDMSPAQLSDIITEDSPGQQEMIVRSTELIGNQYRTAIRIKAVVNSFMQGMFDGLVKTYPHPFSTLGSLGDLLGTSQGLFFAMRRHDPTFAAHMESESDLADNQIPESVYEFLKRIESSPIPVDDGSLDNPLSPEFWDAVTELIRELFGESWVGISIALHTAGIAQPQLSLPSDSQQLFDSNISLCSRVRAARLRRGGVTWWTTQLSNAASDLDRMLWAGLVLSWSSVKTFHALTTELDAVIGSLSKEQFEAIRDTVSSVASRRLKRADRRKVSSLDLRGLSPRTALLAAVAFGLPLSSLVYSRQQEKQEPFRSYFEGRSTAERLLSRPDKKESADFLQWAREVNKARSATSSGSSFSPHLHDIQMSEDSRIAVLADPKRYPSELLEAALSETQRRYRPKPLRMVSADQDWAFED